MIDISNNSILKYLLFSSLYFSEGLMKVISTIILPIYFYEKGIPAEIITFVIGITIVPMVFKFIWGGIADHFIFLGRKTFIIIGGTLSFVSLLFLTIIDPHVALIPFSVLLFISWCGVGFLDASSDAWAIEISQQKQRGKVNGAMYAGQNIGIIAGSLLFPFIVELYGYAQVFAIGAICIFLILLFPLFIKEVKSRKTIQRISPLLFSELKKKQVLQLVIFSPLLFISGGFLILLVPLFITDVLHFDLVHVGLINISFTLALIIGSFIGGILGDIWGRKSMLFFFISVSIVFTSILAFAHCLDLFVLMYSIIGFLQGGYIVVYLAFVMDVTNPRIGATQFSLLTGLGNLGMISTSVISGTLVTFLGFHRIFFLAAWFLGPVLLLLYFIRGTIKYSK